MPRIWPVVKKEINEIKRDPVTLAVMIILPLVVLMIFGYAFNFDVMNLQLAVWDQDRSAESRAYVQGYAHSGYFQVRSEAGSTEEIYEMMDQSLIDAALVIPPDFSRLLLQGRPAQVGIMVDGSYANTAQVVVNLAEAINMVQSGQVAQRLLMRQGGDAPREAVVPEARVWFNPTLKSKNFIIPGLFGVILMSFLPMLAALAVVREREKGSMQQVMVSPIKPYEYILGKLIPYGLIGCAEMAVVLLAAVWWFKIPFHGSVMSLMGVAVLYVLCCVAIGLLVSTITKTQVTAMLLTMLMTFMPAMTVSGFVYPVFSMSKEMQQYAASFPATYFITISRAIVLKGSGWRYLWQDVSTLAVFTLMYLAVAVVLFRKRLA